MANKKHPHQTTHPSNAHPRHDPHQAVKGQITGASFDRFFNHYGRWIVIALGLVLSAVIFREFLVFQKFYLFRDIGSDSITNNFPYVYHVADYLRTDGMPGWSFRQGLGQNIFPGCFSDLFYLPLYLIGKDGVMYGIVYAEILKILCLGFLFFLLLRKLSVSGFAAVLGAVSLAFSGYMVLAGPWQVFSTEAVLFVFLLYAFERLYQNDDWRLFPLAVGLTTIAQPVYMYLHGIFLVLYIGLRLLESGTWNPRKTAILLAKLAGLGCIGLLLSAFMSIASIHEMLNSPRVGGNASYAKKLAAGGLFALTDQWQLFTTVMRLFSNDLIGTGSKFTGWNNYLEAPLFYCGLVNLLLLPQLFQFLDRKRKIGYGLLFGLLAVPVLFPYFRHALWLFTGDYYRGFCLFVVGVIILGGAKALSEIARQGRVNLILLGLTLAALVIGLYFPYPLLREQPMIAVNDDMRSVLAALLAGYALLVALVKISPLKMRSWSWRWRSPASNSPPPPS